MNHTTRYSLPQRLSKGNPLLRVAKDHSTEGQQEKQETTSRAELEPLRKERTHTIVQLHITQGWVGISTTTLESWTFVLQPYHLFYSFYSYTSEL